MDVYWWELYTVASLFCCVHVKVRRWVWVIPANHWVTQWVQEWYSELAASVLTGLTLGHKGENIDPVDRIKTANWKYRPQCADPDSQSSSSMWDLIVTMKTNRIWSKEEGANAMSTSDLVLAKQVNLPPLKSHDWRVALKKKDSSHLTANVQHLHPTRILFTMIFTLKTLVRHQCRCLSSCSHDSKRNSLQCEGGEKRERYSRCCFLCSLSLHVSMSVSAQTNKPSVLWCACVEFTEPRTAQITADQMKKNSLTVFLICLPPLLFVSSCIIPLHLSSFNLLFRPPLPLWLSASSFFFFISAAVPVITPSFWLLSSLPQYPFYCLCLLPSSPSSPPVSPPPLHSPSFLPSLLSSFLAPNPHPTASSLNSSFFSCVLTPPPPHCCFFTKTLVFPPPPPTTTNSSTSRFAASLLEQGWRGPVATMGREGVCPAADHQRIFPDERQSPAAAHQGGLPLPLPSLWYLPLSWIYCRSTSTPTCQLINSIAFLLFFWGGGQLEQDPDWKTRCTN